ncbi:MAG: hypothetical protein P4L99_07905, partial [Chthoniobacter sp.]|nr:hypothetical protein [Chthoniobacter sp.]
MLSFLRVRAVAGGLEISDQMLRLVYPDGGSLQMAAVVLGPGVMARGIVKDADALAGALQALRDKIPALKGRTKKMNVVVSLSSASIYTQSFSLPIVEGKELERAIDLNIQMSSPDDLDKSYFSSEILDRNNENLRLEISAAFIDRQLVDGLTRILFSAGFVTLGVESRALALVRTVRERSTSVDLGGSYLILDLDDTGIDFMVMRKGRLYFEYATPWTDLADAKGEVAMDRFTETVSADLRQVMNFYHQHWQDALAGVLISSTMLEDETEKIAQDISRLPVMPLTVPPDLSLSPEWLVAFGASLRGARADMNDKEINLAGEGVADAFREEQALRFLDLWQVLVPASLGVLLVILAVAYSFFVQAGGSGASLGTSNPGGQQAAQVAALQASSTAFNQRVKLVLAAQAHADMSHRILDELDNLAGQSSVSISRISFRGPDSPISLSGVASTEDDIVQFKSLVEADRNFGTADLPLSGIQPSVSAFSFSM